MIIPCVFIYCSAINANIALSEAHGFEPAVSPEGVGYYIADFHTSNAPVSVAFSSTPDGRPLNLKTNILTQFADVVLKLPSAFAGPVCIRGHHASSSTPNAYDSAHGSVSAGLDGD